jgi:hypothetical protein
MPKKLKFKPAITRVKLNHEQAVLFCGCYNVGGIQTSGIDMTSYQACLSPPTLKQTSYGFCIHNPSQVSS